MQRNNQPDGKELAIAFIAMLAILGILAVMFPC